MENNEPAAANVDPHHAPPVPHAAPSLRPWYLGSLLIGSVLIMGGLQHGRGVTISEYATPVMSITEFPEFAPSQAQLQAQANAELVAEFDFSNEIDDQPIDAVAKLTPEDVSAPNASIEAAIVDTQVDTEPKTPVSADEPALPLVETLTAASVATPTIPAETLPATPQAGTPATDQATELATDPATEQTTAPVSDPSQLATTYRLKVEPGNSLASRLDLLGVPSSNVASLLAAPHAKKLLSKLHTGEVLIVTVNPDASLNELEYHANTGAILRIDRSDHGFESELKQPPPPTTKTLVAQGIINSTFSNAARNAGLNGSTRWLFSSMLKSSINFSKLRRGDQFRALYEETTDSLGNHKQRLLAAELTNRGKTYQAIRYTTKAGRTGNFTPDGEKLGGGIGFLRAPLKYVRISSGFSRHRWHPKLNRVRAHLGVDFAAPRGTPVKSAGPGRITFVGRKSGYGRVVEIEHGKRYKTVYAHLSGFARGLRKGAQVRKGQVIARVGQSGLATGPHLHYEFHVDGKAVDPLKVRLPSGHALAASERKKFKGYAAQVIKQLDERTQAVTVAGNNTEQDSRL